MALALTVADLATTPTGATATVAGSAGGTVTVYVTQVVAALGALTWASGGSRTGNGAVTLTLEKGYYFAYAVESATVTAPVYFVVTDGLDPVATRCRAAIKATIELLDIPPAARVVEQWYDEDGGAPDGWNLEAPGVVLTTAGTQEGEEFYGSVLDDVDVDTLVILHDRQDPRDATALPDYEGWRQAVQRAFRRQRLAGVSEIRWCEVIPYKVAESLRGQFHYVISSFVVRAKTRQVRGLGA